MFHLAREILGAHGFDHYETSNYARPGHQSTHNQGYWQGEDYLGLGPSAVSTLGNTRSKNIADTARYVAMVRTLGHATAEIETLDAEALRLERLALGLRTSDGIGLDLLDEPALARARALAAEGLVGPYRRPPDARPGRHRAGRPDRRRTRVRRCPPADRPLDRSDQFCKLVGMKKSAPSAGECVTIGAFQAKTELSRLLRQTRAGQRFIITQRGTPVAELRPLEAPRTKSAWGDMAGKIWMADDFCDELADMRDYME